LTAINGPTEAQAAGQEKNGQEKSHGPVVAMGAVPVKPVLEIVLNANSTSLNP
jgi:hypothetical protein